MDKEAHIQAILYLNPINFCLPLLFGQEDWARINSLQNRPFFTHLGAQKLILQKFLWYLLEISHRISVI